MEGGRALRQALQAIFARTPGFRCIGAISCAEDGSKLLPAANPQEASVGLCPPSMGVLECIDRMRIELPFLQVVAFSHFHQPDLMVARRREFVTFGHVFSIVRYALLCNPRPSVNPKNQQRGLSRQRHSDTGHPGKRGFDHPPRWPNSQVRAPQKDTRSLRPQFLDSQVEMREMTDISRSTSLRRLGATPVRGGCRLTWRQQNFVRFCRAGSTLVARSDPARQECFTLQLKNLQVRPASPNQSAFSRF